jgi:phosphate starvation-inducible PhoH-like protein
VIIRGKNTTLETTHYSKVITLSPENNRRLLNLCGKFDEHIQLIESRLEVTIKQRSYTFSIKGPTQAVERTAIALIDLYKEAALHTHLTNQQVHLYLQTLTSTNLKSPQPEDKTKMEIRTKRAPIGARGENQIRYIENIQKYDINFGIGPAGTGKTYLAVACAVQALETMRVSRIILVRPIVEAGEKLGFLPGDMAEKVNPYLRPLYDALYEMMGVDTVSQLIERNVIELVPLAYMRGRSLNDSFIILDEGQNTTSEQMQMFLTRIGFNSKAVITGDITQIDLTHQRSGLIHSLDVLKDVKGISFSHFVASDVVRHPLVQSIVEAYERYNKQDK